MNRIVIQYLHQISTDGRAVIAFAEQVEQGGLPKWVRGEQKKAMQQMRTTQNPMDPKNSTKNFLI